MKNTLTFTILLLFALLKLPGNAQNYHLDTLTTLAESVPESSGLLYKEGRFITHNDSGNAPVLYELDTLDGQVVREVLLLNASNVDWEDMTADADFLYIGDIGNNFGNRTDLRIYKIAWSEYLATDTVETQQIVYAYADQSDFSPNQFFTPYDAEALVAIADSLFLFTKDWSTARTKVYPLPKTPGTYSAVAVDSFAVPGLITGADLSPSGDQLLFTGYSGTSAFVFHLSEFLSSAFSDATSYTWPLPLTGSVKSEGICWSDDRFAFITTEQVGTLPPMLYRLDTDFISNADELLLENQSVKVYPLPATEKIEVAAEHLQGLELYNAYGNMVLKTEQTYLDVSHLPAGMYTLIVLLKDQVVTKQVVVF